MAKKNKAQSEKVRVKKSYYTFSKTYPRSSIQRSGESDEKKSSRRFFKIILCVLATFCLICAGYFAVSVISGLFNAPVSADTESSQSAEVEKPAFESSDLKAYTLPREKIDDRSYIKKFIRFLKRRDANAVIVDFKSSDGSLLFSSKSLIASANSYYDNGTVRRMIQLFKNKDIAVIASFSCFRDNHAPEADPDLAVKYSDTEVNWSSNGFSWLNPCSKGARSYLYSLIREVCGFDIDGIILKNAFFPVDGDAQNASFPGEKNAAERNAVLEQFVSKVRKISGCFVAIEIPARILLDDENDPFYGSFSSVCETVIFDVSDRPDGYFLDKDSEYSSMFSLFGSLIHIEECESIIKLPADEATNHFIRTMKSAGYKAVVIDE